MLHNLIVKRNTSLAIERYFVAGCLVWTSVLRYNSKVSLTERKMVADGAIAQLARAPALQAGGPGFESPLLHQLSFFAQQYGVSQASVCSHSTKVFMD